MITININSVERKFYLILFSILFAFVFINLFEPFGLYHDATSDGESTFIGIAIGLVVAFFIMLISQLLLRPMLTLNQTTPFFFVGIFVFEAVFVSLSWTLLENDDTNKNEFAALWLENLLGYGLIFVLPYFLILLIVHLKDTTNENKSLKADYIRNDQKILNLKDEMGITRLSLPTKNIRLVQSADNYLSIHHLDNNNLTKFLLRNSLKNLEEQLANTSILRCHRSSMVNKDCIETIKKTSFGLELTIRDMPDVILPVSKSYVSEFKKIDPTPQNS